MIKTHSLRLMFRRRHTCLDDLRGCLLAVTFWLISPSTGLLPLAGATCPLPEGCRGWTFSWTRELNMMSSKAWLVTNMRLRSKAAHRRWRNWFSCIDHSQTTELSPAQRDWREAIEVITFVELWKAIQKNLSIKKQSDSIDIQHSWLLRRLNIDMLDSWFFLVVK